MSSTIPFIFPYLTLDGEPVTDGGLISSLFDIFPNGPRPILGLRARADHSLKKTIQDVKVSKLFIWDYLKILAEYLLDALDNQHVPETEWTSTIIIPTSELGGFNFYIGSEETGNLVEYGYDAVMNSEILDNFGS